jgi:hypothetical protein
MGESDKKIGFFSIFVQVGEKLKRSLPMNKEIESELKNLKAV